MVLGRDRRRGRRDRKLPKKRSMDLGWWWRKERSLGKRRDESGGRALGVSMSGSRFEVLREEQEMKREGELSVNSEGFDSGKDGAERSEGVKGGTEKGNQNFRDASHTHHLNGESSKSFKLVKNASGNANLKNTRPTKTTSSDFFYYTGKAQIDEEAVPKDSTLDPNKHSVVCVERKQVTREEHKELITKSGENIEALDMRQDGIDVRDAIMVEPVVMRHETMALGKPPDEEHDTDMIIEVARDGESMQLEEKNYHRGLCDGKSA